MDLFIEVVSGVIAVVSLSSAVVAAVKAKRAGQPIPWDKVRPVAIQAFQEVEGLVTANKMGYQDVEDYVVSFIMNRIDSSNILSNTEKVLVSEGLVRSIVAPGLKDLHNKLTKAPAAPEAPAAAPAQN